MLTSVHVSFAVLGQNRRMLAMIGTVSPRTTTSGLGALTARLRSYQAVRVSEFEAVLLIPSVGAVLVDAQPTRIRFQLAAKTREALDLLIAKLSGELLGSGSGSGSELEPGFESTLAVEWTPAQAVPIPFR
ncbi:hypothetical protein BH10ACT7_BH10ACT7_16930 [soil metagenome]